MIRHKDTEQKLFDKGYWKLSKGSDADMPTIVTSPKWSVMINTLLKDDVNIMITEDQIVDYINNDK